MRRRNPGEAGDEIITAITPPSTMVSSIANGELLRNPNNAKEIIGRSQEMVAGLLGTSVEVIRAVPYKPEEVNSKDVGDPSSKAALIIAVFEEIALKRNESPEVMLANLATDLADGKIDGAVGNVDNASFLNEFNLAENSLTERNEDFSDFALANEAPVINGVGNLIGPPWKTCTSIQFGRVCKYPSASAWTCYAGCNAGFDNDPASPLPDCPPQIGLNPLGPAALFCNGYPVCKSITGNKCIKPSMASLCYPGFGGAPACLSESDPDGLHDVTFAPLPNCPVQFDFDPEGPAALFCAS